MQIGSLVQYRYFHQNGNLGWGVVTEINSVDPDRPFFFIRWIIATNEHHKKLNDTWYHPSRLEVVCK